MDMLRCNSGQPMANNWNQARPPAPVPLQPAFNLGAPGAGPSPLPFVPNPNNPDEIYAWCNSLKRPHANGEHDRERYSSKPRDSVRESRRYSRSPSSRERRGISRSRSEYPESRSYSSSSSYTSSSSRSKDYRSSERSSHSLSRSSRSRDVRKPDSFDDYHTRNYNGSSSSTSRNGNCAPDSRSSHSHSTSSRRYSPDSRRMGSRRSDSVRLESCSDKKRKRSRSPSTSSAKGGSHHIPRSISRSRDRRQESERPRERSDVRNGRLKDQGNEDGRARPDSRPGGPSSVVFHGLGLPGKAARPPLGSERTDNQLVPTSTTKGQVEYRLAFLKDDEEDEAEAIPAWIRSAPDDLYYDRNSSGEMVGTDLTTKTCEKFSQKLVEKPQALRLEAEALGAAKMAELIAEEKAEDEVESGETGSSSSDSSDDDSGPTRSDKSNDELSRRRLHPRRLHQELWHNDPGLMNDGPVCRCSAKARRCGIRHGFYPGETRIEQCKPYSNNPGRLFHYRVTVSPLNNFLVNKPTVIKHDGHDFVFEGFSLLSHHEIDLTQLPPCSVIRFNIRYDVTVEADWDSDKKFRVESFCVRELDLFQNYLFREVLELVDLKFGIDDPESCPSFHILPRFVRPLPDNGKEILSMSRVLIHLISSDKELLREEDLSELYTIEQKQWQTVADIHKGTIVTKWGMKPAAIRVDQIDRDVSGHEQPTEDGIPFPLIVHFGIRPPQLSYAGNTGYQRAWRRYVKYRHLLSNMSKPSANDKRKLIMKEQKLQEMRTASSMKRDVTVAVSSKGFRSTGLCCDIVQHAMLIPVLIGHLRFHKSLSHLEKRMEYHFKTPYLLQLALTHPSYRENFGTNPDHARNALTNCGIRQPEYGDRKIHYAFTRKRGINTLINIMAKFGESCETKSEITHNERLEFLGDAVVEFVTSIHLFHLFPDLEEGGLATYRAAIVQNQHLAVLAQTLQLDQFLLYAHGSDLCHDSELRHAMANCLEALMGAIFLDGGITEADRVFGNTLFADDSNLRDAWKNYPKHPLQSKFPDGDRHLIEKFIALQDLHKFEESIGVEFTHIRLLARAFTDRNMGYTVLAEGSNQRLEFLGDTVLQLISSEYLYRFFPDHHEGHLSLLRSSLVNNRTQSLVCDDLNMTKYSLRLDNKPEKMKTKDRADLLEAFLGALYIDKGLNHCIAFCKICFIPRLTDSIVKQEWNDPKSKLQQCCLTLRAMNGREPDIPVYKVIECQGPTNTRIYIVAVYFRGRRLACGGGHSIQDAEMCAAATALEKSGKLFPQLNHQKKILDQTKRVNPGSSTSQTNHKSDK